MSHEILSVKLAELDRRMGRLHSRIQLSETGTREDIRRETEALRRECQEDRSALTNQMRFSRFRPAAQLAGAFEEIQAILDRTREDIRRQSESGADRELEPEEKILLAEHMLDFAMQAANRALLISLEAIAVQREPDGPAVGPEEGSFGRPGKAVAPTPPGFI